MHENKPSTNEIKRRPIEAIASTARVQNMNLMCVLKLERVMETKQWMDVQACDVMWRVHFEEGTQIFIDEK
jgi:hypothetical protein